MMLPHTACRTLRSQAVFWAQASDGKLALSHPTWLDIAHTRLDEAVFATYEEILEKLPAFGSLRFAKFGEE